ncbi:hypothetical protein AB0M46_47325, partial [Dactylosporangium sp. NPDC051485]|uniref:hypothetical protein n=1 Tax=Dactylosporangium sp. NPDC051485 TaxID=3154846 RepID=UPI003422639F
KLYITMTMLAARPPYDIQNVPSRRWAELLALPDPETNGARRIADALNWLQSAKLVELQRNPGLPPRVVLQSPSGNGAKYSWRGDWWVNIPVGFWGNRWIYELCGYSVAFLFVFRDMRSNRAENDPPWLTTAQKARYGFSEDTWTRATKDLCDRNLLVVRRAPQGKDFDYTRLRNTYWLDIDKLSSPVVVPEPVGDW